MFDLERNILMMENFMNLLACRKDSVMSHCVDSDDWLNAYSCLSSMKQNFYNSPRDQILLADLPTNLFGARTTAPV